MKFISAPLLVRVENSGTLFTNRYTDGEILRLPVAHGEGRYFAPPPVLDELEQDGRVIFRYVTASGERTSAANPNGSERDIAGIVSEDGNVLGMMPHPERACSPLLGSEDGVRLLESILARVAA
jgi:phosphoribosylformylglycinamidine synthase